MGSALLKNPFAMDCAHAWEPAGRPAAAKNGCPTPQGAIAADTLWPQSRAVLYSRYTLDKLQIDYGPRAVRRRHVCRGRVHKDPMPREYVGHLPHHDPLHPYLRRDILPQIGV